MDHEAPRLRLSILGIVAFSLFSVMFARLWYLQIMATDQGEIEAANNRVRVIREEAPRGRILDARGRVLVDNRTSLVVAVDPHGLAALAEAQRADLLLRLATELTRSGAPTKVAALERRLADPQYSPLQPVPVAIDVPDDLMIFLAERADDFPAVRVQRQTVRRYPEASLAAHVVGYVGRISEPELAAHSAVKAGGAQPLKPYEPDSTIGKTGIERSFEDDLRGIPGQRVVEVDRNGAVVRELEGQRQLPEPGNDVQLSIDLDVQRSTEQSLQHNLEELRGSTTDQMVAAKAGSAVVLDPRTGNVVAMASYPTYDPTEFVNGISSDRYQQLVGGPGSANPLTNRAVAGLYAPGSTFKLITAYAGLSDGIVRPDETVNDNGVYVVGNRPFRNAKNEVHGPVNLSRAITVSSDVYFYRLGDIFWKDHDQPGVGDGIQDAARAFGFGAPTGVQLLDEAKGLVPDPVWKQQTFDALPEDQKRNGDGRWYGGDSANLAIGQGDMLATPLQLANSYATFAAHGVRHRPSLVLRVLHPHGDPEDPAAVVRTIDPQVVSQVPIPPEHFDALRQGLGGVTSDPKGTATVAFAGFDQSNWPVMGKTGTAEVATKADTSLFVGIGPADAPQFVAAVVLEESGFGADVAAPVVRTIFDRVSGQSREDPCGSAGAGDGGAGSAPAGASAGACPSAGGTRVAAARATAGANRRIPDTTGPPTSAPARPRTTTTRPSAGAPGRRPTTAPTAVLGAAPTTTPRKRGG
jgi:penicillin-binding protein 2